jgi:hypothetical protein
MSVTRTSSTWRGSDHFEPDNNLDPAAQRRLRGNLEQIDYIAFAASREVVSSALQSTDTRAFQKLAVAAAHARVRWVTEALAAADSGHPLTPAQVDKLAELRHAFHESTEAYEALRRLVERGYLKYTR